VSDTTTETPQEEAAEPVDEQRQALVDVLRTELGDALLDAVIAKGDLTVRIDRSVWKRAAEICRDRLRMEYFCFLSGIDWLPSDLSGEKSFEPAGAPVEDEDADTPLPSTIETGVAGGDTRFQVFARYYSIVDHVGITLKADLDDNDPRVDSIVEVFRGADWHERETWEMFGFQFDGHPGIRHIYLPTGFEGHPLRKDFPLLSREVKPWPGLVDVEPIPGDDTPAEGEAGEGGES
jgi:NADH-quinone oxidoreductase subunit C